MYPIYNYIGEEINCESKPIAFPRQHQDSQPGLEYLMVPPPIFNYLDYIASDKLKDKVAIITGGDSGIGRAISVLFAKEGCDIVISYLDEHIDANETKRVVESYGRRCLLIPGDLTIEETSKEIVKKTIDFYGKINILVNNCGKLFPEYSITDITEEQLNLTFRTNIYSYFFMTKAVVPYLHENDSIINTTSVTAYSGSPEMIDYSSTKGAIVSFTRSLSLSLVAKLIRVNAVAPGPVWTPLVVVSLPEKDIASFGTPVPMKRAAQPFEIATSYLFLASDDSRYMSGQVLHPNGGRIVGS